MAHCAFKDGDNSHCAHLPGNRNVRGGGKPFVKDLTLAKWKVLTNGCWSPKWNTRSRGRISISMSSAPDTAWFPMNTDLMFAVYWFSLTGAGPGWKQCGRTAFRDKGPGKPETTADRFQHQEARDWLSKLYTSALTSSDCELLLHQPLRLR